MVKVNIISGFLGAGKTTLIKKLLTGSVAKEKIILLENEYGEVGVDGSFMKDSGIIVDELNSGCICCTLVGDFQKAVDDLIAKYHPDRLLIEPSGVGKLSDVIVAVENTVADIPDMKLNSFVTVADATNARKVLNRQLAPGNDRRIVLDPDAEAAALGLSGFADVSKSGDARPIIDGTIGRKYGFDWAMDQQVPSFEASVMTEGALTVNGANEAGAQVVSLAFHRDAIAFATRPLMDSANGLGNLTQSAVDPVSGLSLRLEVSREHKRTRFSYDILYGADVVRRELGCRIAG